MLSVLLIDDDEMFRSSVRSALSGAWTALHIAEARDRTSAERALHVRVDLIVTDLTMPGFEGDEILDTIDRLQPSTPVIVLTGSIARADAGAGRPEREWLQKPCSLSEIRSAVSRALGLETRDLRGGAGS